jgi:hypothetical protein
MGFVNHRVQVHQGLLSIGPAMGGGCRHLQDLGINATPSGQTLRTFLKG